MIKIIEMIEMIEIIKFESNLFLNPEFEKCV